MWKKEIKKQEKEQIRLKQNELPSCEPDPEILQMFTTAHAVLGQGEIERVKKAIERLEKE